MSDNYFKTYPDQKGFFEDYGGSFIPEVLEAEMKKITEAYHRISKSHNFISELRSIRKHYQGRPTPVYYCNRLSEKYGGRIYLKREDLNHTGAHKLNHCMGEALLAKHLGKKRLIAETGAGQHGVALATAAAYFGLECEIHMGEVDIVKEHPNVVRMQILGAKIVPVTHGLRTLKEAVDSAFEAYLKDPVNSIYCIGSVVGPHPFPMLVRDFQRIVGIEARDQFQEMTGELPDNVVACVGGGSNSIGIFSAFLDDGEVELYGVEPAGRDINVLGEHAATISCGKPGVIHGFKCYMLQDEKGEPAPVYSVASGLDYPGVGPEHSMLHDWGRVNYTSVNDKEAIDAFYELSRLEGIIPALESAHAMAYAVKLAQEKPNQSILVNLSGRGDKDVDFVVDTYGLPCGTPAIKVNLESVIVNQHKAAEAPVVSENENVEKEEVEIKDAAAEQEKVSIEEVEENNVVEAQEKASIEEVEETEIVAEQEKASIEEVEETKVVAEQEKVSTEEVEENKVVAEQEKAPEVEILDFKEEEKPEELKETVVAEKEEKPVASNVIADKYNSNASVIGDRSRAITDVRKAISITDRFLYLKELFGNNMDAFNDALDEVNKAESLLEATTYLSRFNWEDNETSQQFMRLISCKF